LRFDFQACDILFEEKEEVAGLNGAGGPDLRGSGHLPVCKDAGMC
jgi:hypothetical protein